MYASGQSDFLQTLTTRKAIARNHAKTMPRYHHFFQRFAVVESAFAQRFHTFWYHKFDQSGLVESKIANVLHRRRQPQRFQRTTPAKRCRLDELGFLLWKVTDCKLLHPEKQRLGIERISRCGKSIAVIWPYSKAPSAKPLT